MDETITIEIDLEIHKLIESERRSFSETSGQILRRLLKLEPKETNISRSLSNDGLDIGDGVFLPNGTSLRKRYRGTLYEVSVENGKILYKGKGYTSASGAAVAVTGSSVNGWIFWESKRPDDIDYRLLNDIRHSVPSRQGGTNG
jgi:hypothetical protein